MTMSVRFWGVRGSIASPGEATATVGGNTSCVEVRCGERVLVLDAGTGIRGLGESLLAEGCAEVTLLLSHLHWDHIQGLPFFVPAYVPGTRIAVVGRRTAEMTLEEALSHQMRAPVFPVRLGELGAQIGCRHVAHGETIHVGDARITAAKLNHPGGVLGYRIEHGGRSVVYATDTEHYSCVDPTLRTLAQNADVLVYDAQYLPEEYAAKVGWGHSTWEAAVEVARAAGVRRLVLFHHDPKRTDEGVASIQTQARRRFADTLAAREGMVIELEGATRTRAA